MRAVIIRASKYIFSKTAIVDPIRIDLNAQNSQKWILFLDCDKSDYACIVYVTYTFFNLTLHNISNLPAIQEVC